jgi:hypothetical protein
VLLHVNLEAGHGGKSGRFERIYEVAREYGFVIALAQGRFGLHSSPHEPAGNLLQVKSPRG